jgi:hypothetical protein
MRNLIRMGGIAAFSVLLFKLLGRASDRADAKKASHFPHVRDAGPDEQEGIAPEDWDLVDEQSDESFPASDPPGNY